MTTFEVYRQVALDSIKCYGNLEVLSYAWQTAHLDASHPSWIPRWDMNTNDWTPRALLPFIYNATGGTSPRLQPSVEANTLTIQGLNLGPIMETNSLLRFAGEQTLGNYPDGGRFTKDHLMTMSRIMVQDRFQEPADLENAADRSNKNLEAHFADFSAYLLPLLKTHGQDSYISFCSTWCDLCHNFIAKRRDPTSNVPSAYFCDVCNPGTFDICTDCYNSGKWCRNSEHILRCAVLSGLYCPYSHEIIDQLEAHAHRGNGDRFFHTARSACSVRVFLRTSQGWRGVGPRTIEPGDTLVVLFGSRVPFILRKHGSFYRLIGDCYIDGLMDGEAIQMWESGELKAEEFNIR
jgi:hypothetical protein